MSKYDKSYYDNNKEKIRGAAKLYYQNNKEKVLERSKIYYQENKDKIQEYNQKYWAEHGRCSCWQANAVTIDSCCMSSLQLS